LGLQGTKLNRWVVSALAVLAPVFYVGCQNKADPLPSQTAPIVEVATVIQKDVPVYGEWVGTVQGYLDARISPQVSGYLVRQDYREGGIVQKGQVLFEIDPRPYQAALDQAKAQLAEAEAQLAKATLDVHRDVPEAQAHAIPLSQLDNDRQAQLAAQASVEAGKAAVEQAELNLGYTRVRSLIPGIAGIATVQVGNLVGPSTVLTTVSQVDPIKVYFPINEQQYLQIAGGGKSGSVDFVSHASAIPLQLILSDGSTYPYHGRILFADRQVDPATGTIQVVGSFPNPHHLLRPGLYARVRAQTAVLKGALLVPQQAVSELQGSYQVVVVGADNRVTLRSVQVGQTVGSMWVITSGLKPGERVVAEGTQKARPGALVIPKPFVPAGNQ
jgi:membrane fusion protein (multidrug efflux system)